MLQKDLILVLLHRCVSISPQSQKPVGAQKVGTFNWVGCVTEKRPWALGRVVWNALCSGFPEAVPLDLPVLGGHEENSWFLY